MWRHNNDDDYGHDAPTHDCAADHGGAHHEPPSVDYDDAPTHHCASDHDDDPALALDTGSPDAY